MFQCFPCKGFSVLLLFSDRPYFFLVVQYYFAGVNILHSVWSIPMRQSLEGSLTTLTQAGQRNAQTELLAAIVLPEVSEIGASIKIFA